LIDKKNFYNIKTGHTFRASFLFVVSIFLVVILSGCQSDHVTELPSFALSGSTMGTTYSITVVEPAPEINSEILQRSIDTLLQDLNQQMSTYIAGSEISRFNQIETQLWHSISPEFLEVILLSQNISKLSDGYFDISIGPLVELWGFGKKESSSVPDDIAIENAKQRVGWQHLQIDTAKQQISKAVDLWLDVSAIAKGYGVDKVAELLDQTGIENYLVEIGGEMRVSGINAKQRPWRIGIETPTLGQRGVQQVIELNDYSVATSGDYRNFFEENGQRFSHTIDPNTGKPVRHNIASVTVIEKSAAKADALATALNVLGEEKALQLAEKEQLAAFFIFYDNKNSGERYLIHYTDAFIPFLVEN
jgi:thiamine biosynthesis lipoprotein